MDSWSILPFLEAPLSMATSCPFLTPNEIEHACKALEEVRLASSGELKVPLTATWSNGMWIISQPKDSADLIVINKILLDGVREYKEKLQELGRFKPCTYVIQITAKKVRAHLTRK